MTFRLEARENQLKLRTFLRSGHVVIACLTGAYIYSPTLNDSAGFQALMQFVVFPIIALTGLVMWQQGRIMKWVQRGKTPT